jgi:hypothetical protein
LVLGVIARFNTVDIFTGYCFIFDVVIYLWIFTRRIALMKFEIVKDEEEVFIPFVIHVENIDDYRLLIQNSLAASIYWTLLKNKEYKNECLSFKLELENTQRLTKK